MAELTYDFFLGFLNESFYITEILTKQQHAFKLTRIAGTPEKPFSLTFQAEILVPQDSYEMDMPDGTKDYIFIVPIAQVDTGYEYQAIFN